MNPELKRIVAASMALTFFTGGWVTKNNVIGVSSENKPQLSYRSTFSDISSPDEVLKNLVSKEVYSSSSESKVSSLEVESSVSSEVELVSFRVTSSKPEEIVSSSPEVYSTPTEFAEMENVTVIEYGKSGLGWPLEAMLIQPTKEVKRTVLLTFELHGYEDSYPKDGQVLVDLGKALIEYFAKNPNQLGNTALYIIPSANPDGLIDGTTNNGPGRCQVSLGVDMNRDFDYRWEKENSSRNKTLSPFSCPESQALRDLVLEIKPNDVVDIHGWLATSYGDSSLCQHFNVLGIRRSNSLGTSGYFASWAKQFCQRTALIELPGPKTDPQKLIQAVTYLCAE